MKRLKITNDHGWTPRTLHKQERKIKNTLLRQRVMAVRLVMEGYLGKEVASMVNVCRQTVSHSVSLFNEGGLKLLLHRDFAPGREPFLTEEQQEEIKQLVLTTTPVGTGLGRRFGVEHQTPAILCRKALRCLHFPRSVAKTPAPQRAVVDTADLHIGER
ncbi:helix-turn-helix domain-containing protein [Geobacillus sp. T6]|uniref:helix-turn-helix domain-containing protein n=1 Tax=Geobacillus sp. T6 TaxID=1659191 RepID=UPI0006CE17DE|nr:helix-turn-helix domain-containing protein [Geobacillus sp. T6]KPC98870.1 hypothetical protein LR69_02965 [Geobacillus sp. BCO2]